MRQAGRGRTRQSKAKQGKARQGKARQRPKAKGKALFRYQGFSRNTACTATFAVCIHLPTVHTYCTCEQPPTDRACMPSAGTQRPSNLAAGPRQGLVSNPKVGVWGQGETGHEPRLSLEASACRGKATSGRAHRGGGSGPLPGDAFMETAFLEMDSPKCLSTEDGELCIPFTILTATAMLRSNHQEHRA